MRYAYQRGGAPLLQWGMSAPHQSRAGGTIGMGSLAGTTLDDPTLVLPAPGAPEPVGITRAAMSGCSCSGTCGCGTPLSGLADAVPGGYLTLGVAAFLAWKFLKKRSR